MSDETLAGLAACPFCGSKQLSPGLWSLDIGEVDAVECLHCFAGAPLTAWQNLSQRPEIQ